MGRDNKKKSLEDRMAESRRNHKEAVEYMSNNPDKWVKVSDLNQPYTNYIFVESNKDYNVVSNFNCNVHAVTYPDFWLDQYRDEATLPGYVVRRQVSDDDVIDKLFSPDVIEVISKTICPDAIGEKIFPVTIDKQIVTGHYSIDGHRVTRPFVARTIKLDYERTFDIRIPINSKHPDFDLYVMSLLRNMQKLNRMHVTNGCATYLYCLVEYRHSVFGFLPRNVNTAIRMITDNLHTYIDV